MVKAGLERVELARGGRRKMCAKRGCASAVGNHPDRQAEARIGPGVEILDKEARVLEVGESNGADEGCRSVRDQPVVDVCHHTVSLVPGSSGLYLSSGSPV